jgi:hypothetical protein
MKQSQTQPGRAPQTGTQMRHDEDDRAGQVRGQNKTSPPKNGPGPGERKESRDPTSNRHADPEEDLNEDRAEKKPAKNAESGKD